MTFVLASNVRETSIVTGTGTATLAGAVAGYKSFSAIGDGNTTRYEIRGGSEWEIGIGTYTASGTTLSRDTVLSSSNSDAAVTFSAGTKYVTCVAAAPDIQTPITSYSPSGGGTATLNLGKGEIHDITMPSGNITIALSNVRIGRAFVVRITQDGTGSRTVTWFTTIRWAGGSAPTLTTTASKTDLIGFIPTGATTFDGVVIGQNL